MATPRRSSDADLPLMEPVPGPISRSVAEPRWFGLPASVLLLCVGFAGVGAGVGLIASGRWPWGLVLLGIGALLVLASAEAARRQPENAAVVRASLVVSDGRSRAATSSQVLRARVAELRERRRAQSRLTEIDTAKLSVFRDLGLAVWDSDDEAAERARARLTDLEEERRRVERELEASLRAAEERIRLARLPVDRTVMVAPNEPSSPYPPPDEGTPPTPAPVPEPYPPPDEGTPPVPDPGQDEPA